MAKTGGVGLALAPVKFLTLQPTAGLAPGLVAAVGPLRVGCPRCGPLEPLRPVGVVGGIAGVEQLGFVGHSAAALRQCLVRGQQVENAVPLVALDKQHYTVFDYIRLVDNTDRAVGYQTAAIIENGRVQHLPPVSAGWAAGIVRHIQLRERFMAFL